MKCNAKHVSNAINEALFDVALILATGLFRARQRALLLPGNGGSSETGLDSSPESSVHSMRLGARGERL